MKTYCSFILCLSIFGVLSASAAVKTPYQVEQKMGNALLKGNPYRNIKLPKVLLLLSKQQCQCAQTDDNVFNANNDIEKGSCSVSLIENIEKKVQLLAKGKKHPVKYRQALLAKMIIQSESCFKKAKK